MILNDGQITELAHQGMISPFQPQQVREREGTRIISKGLTSYGYDVTLSNEIQIFSNSNALLVDPKKMDENCLVTARKISDESGNYVILPPNSYMLGYTRETFHMPSDVLAICLGKSTYARAGAIVNVTPIEPGWKGQIVIEIANATSLPMKIYVGEGIAQLVFFRGEPCLVSYADRAGKYQGQRGITLPTV